MTSSLNSPHEVAAGPGTKAAYLQYRATDCLHTPYRLPYSYVAGTKKGLIKKPDCSLIVFVNARAGGGDGPALALALSRAVGRAQVFDINENRPDEVLKRVWSNFQAAEDAGDNDAAYYRQRLRIIVAGGDGTIVWILATIKQLKLHPQPGVAIIPLGTGNDLSRSFGWGSVFDQASIKSYEQLYLLLMRVACAKAEPLDCWTIEMRLPKLSLQGPLPHCLGLTTKSDQASEPVTVKGMFWNYLSVGLDAQAAYGFHQLREAHPSLTASQLSNQMWYSWFSCTSGWFCGAAPITRKATLSILHPGSSTWREVELQNDVRAVVLLNLQSYAGGRSLWGTAPVSKKESDKGLRNPSYNDGLVEVVGLTNGYHTAMVLGTKGNLTHARRICQAAGVRITLRACRQRTDGKHSHCFLQIDGEPWRQNVSDMADKEPLTVEVMHAGTSQLYHCTMNPTFHPHDFPSPTRNNLDTSMTCTANQPSNPNELRPGKLSLLGQAQNQVVTGRLSSHNVSPQNRVAADQVDNGVQVSLEHDTQGTGQVSVQRHGQPDLGGEQGGYGHNEDLRKDHSSGSVLMKKRIELVENKEGGAGQVEESDIGPASPVSRTSSKS